MNFFNAREKRIIKEKTEDIVKFLLFQYLNNLYIRYKDGKSLVLAVT
jgi:hypothetical protein